MSREDVQDRTHNNALTSRPCTLAYAIRTHPGAEERRKRIQLYVWCAVVRRTSQRDSVRTRLLASPGIRAAALCHLLEHMAVSRRRLTDLPVEPVSLRRLATAHRSDLRPHGYSRLCMGTTCSGTTCSGVIEDTAALAVMIPAPSCDDTSCDVAV